MAAKVALHHTWQRAAFLMWSTVCGSPELALYAHPKLTCALSRQPVCISRAEGMACLLVRQHLEVQGPVLLRASRPLVMVSEVC